MNVLLFGATGMIGQGVLRECLHDPAVTHVQTIGRTPTGVHDPKLHEIPWPDAWGSGPIEAQLSGVDACFFCLGVSSAGMSEAEYARVTYGITLAVAATLARLNPGMTFIYVSGAGTDSSEHGRSMWARIKGKTENALLRLPFKGAYMFRPGIIQPLHGIRSRTPAYRLFYTLGAPLLPIIRWAFPGQVTTTEQIGRAMIAVAAHGAPQRILESRDIAALVPR